VWQPEDVVRLVDAEIEREYGVLPIKASKTELTLAIVDPIDKTGIEKVKEITGKKVRLVVTSEEGLEHALESIYSTDYTITSTSNLLTRSPRESAFKVLSRGQSIFFSVLFFLSLILAILDFTSLRYRERTGDVFYIGFQRIILSGLQRMNQDVKCRFKMKNWRRLSRNNCLYILCRCRYIKKRMCCESDEITYPPGLPQH
jgi:hypothetical protein